MAKQTDLGREAIPSLVLRLAIPAMVAQFVSVLYSIVDRMYIGNIPIIGETALAGVGVCGPIVTLISSFAVLVGLGGAPLLAMRMGERDAKGANAILANCFLLLVILSAGLTVTFWLLKDALLLWFGASAATFPYADSYLTIYTAGTFFALLSAGLNPFIICQGHPVLGMLSVVIGAVLNLVLDPVFIFVFDLGVTGAAWATVLSQLASCVFVVAVLLHKTMPVRITLGGYAPRIWRRVLTFGLSPFVIIATDSVLLIVMNTVLQRYGGAGEGDRLISAATIMQSWLLLITMPMAGITGGTQPILSYNYGAKQTARIRQGVHWILLCCVGFTTGMLVLSWLVSPGFAAIFTRDEEHIRLAVRGIRIFTLAIVPLAFQYTFVDALTALGICRVALSLSLFRKTLFLASTLCLPALTGASNAFFAEPIADFCGAILSTTVFTLLFGQLMRRRDDMPEGQSLYT